MVASGSQLVVGVVASDSHVVASGSHVVASDSHEYRSAAIGDLTVEMNPVQ